MINGKFSNQQINTFSNTQYTNSKFRGRYDEKVKKQGELLKRNYSLILILHCSKSKEQEPKQKTYRTHRRCRRRRSNRRKDEREHISKRRKSAY
jgi:hypothetical protein